VRRARGVPDPSSSPERSIPAKRTRTDVANETVPDSELQIPPLPGISLSQVYADYFRYLFEHTEAMYKAADPQNSETWTRLRDEIYIVIATPNGWETDQHVFLRNAAIRGGLVTEQNADKLLEYVTESEASVHQMLEYTKPESWRNVKTLGIIDAGGSSVDSTLYDFSYNEDTKKLTLKELCARECVIVSSLDIKTPLSNV
jgi:hypothetical protein